LDRVTACCQQQQEQQGRDKSYLEKKIHHFEGAKVAGDARFLGQVIALMVLLLFVLKKNGQKNVFSRPLRFDCTLAAFKSLFFRHNFRPIFRVRKRVQP
jgi:hypothetical protein